jgi:hypothetical protein
MALSAAIMNPLLLRVKRERDKQDVRDRRNTKFWVRSSENLELSPVSFVPLFSQVSRVCDL